VLSAITVAGGIVCLFCATLGVEARVGLSCRFSDTVVRFETKLELIDKYW
jgi:hypothetical protein